MKQTQLNYLQLKHLLAANAQLSDFPLTHPVPARNAPPLTVARPTVQIQPIAPTDATLIDEMHDRLSPESLYYRYLQHRKPALAEIAAICGLSPERGAGFVATLPSDRVQPSRPHIVGMAFYVREDGGRSHTAEPGLLVEDRHQGQGIGRALWRHLQDHAQANRVRWLRVLFHPNNQRILSLLRHDSLPYHVGSLAGLNEYLIALGAPPRRARLQQLFASIGLKQFGNEVEH